MGKIEYNKQHLLIGLVVSGLYISLSFASFPFVESLERFIYGAQMRLDLTRTVGPSDIALVNIDDKSIEQLGSWPWPRQLIADMASILTQNGARLIGLDILFPEKEKNQGLIEVEKLYQSVMDRRRIVQDEKWLVNTLEDIKKRLDNDSILIKTIKESGNIILPVIGNLDSFKTELPLTKDSMMEKSAVYLPGLKARLRKAPPANKLTTPYSELTQNSRGLGHINLPLKERIRGQAHLLFINFRGHIIPSMPLRIALEYYGKPLQESIDPSKGIQLADRTVPILEGEIFIKFKGGRQSFPYYSFVDILNVKKVPAVFEDKIVLIGYTAEDAPVIHTPVDPRMPRVELTANIIEALMNGEYLSRPDSLVYVETALILIISLFAALLFPKMDFFNRFAASTGLLLITFVIGCIFFFAFDIWMKTAYVMLSLITITLVIFLKDLYLKQKLALSKESIETNRMLGLTFQSQGLLDLAFEKFRKCPLDDAMKDVIYNLGLDYERKRMINKAIAVYEYITSKDKTYRRLDQQIVKLKKLITAQTVGGPESRKEDKIVVSEDLEVKPTVGRYEILNELGQGAMGIVYKARDPKIHRLVAIKTVRFSDEFEEDKVREVKDRFLMEAEIAGKLSHPNIVAVYDVGEDYDLTYIAMEFLEGRDLTKHCKKGALLPFVKVLQVIADAAIALNHAHHYGVIHRDIKPGNIMLVKDGKVKVTDFGIAKAVSASQTKSGIVLGTPNYMSPEQINGHPVDGRSDLFSLGVVFFELLTGQLPFRGNSMANLFYQITQVKHPSPRQINPRIPKPVEQILDKTLAKDPEKRFKTAGDLARYLKALIEKIDEIRARSQTA